MLCEKKGFPFLIQEALHYKYSHTDTLDIKQIDALQALLDSKKGLRSIKIACGDNQWLGLNKDGWAISVCGEDKAVELAFVEIEDGIFNIIIVSDKKDKLYYSLGCNNNGRVGIWPANKVYPWQASLESDGKVKIISIAWGNCCKMMRCKGFFYVLDENKMSKYPDDNIFGFELKVGENISNIMSLRIVNDIKLSCDEGQWIKIDEKGYANAVNRVENATLLHLLEIGFNRYSILVGSIGSNSKCYSVLDCKRTTGCVGIYNYTSTDPWWVSYNYNDKTVNLGSDYWGKEYKMMRWGDYFYIDRISKLKSYMNRSEFAFRFVEIDGSQLSESKENIFKGNIYGTNEMDGTVVNRRCSKTPIFRCQIA